MSAYSGKGTPSRVQSVFARVGAIVAAVGDYTSSQVTNLSVTAPGATVTDALNGLAFAQSRIVEIFTASDFPAADGQGVRTLSSNTVYRIHDIINIGSDRLRVVGNVDLIGDDFSGTGIESSTQNVAGMFALDTSGVFSIKNMRITHNEQSSTFVGAGTFLDFDRLFVFGNGTVFELGGSVVSIANCRVVNHSRLFVQRQNSGYIYIHNTVADQGAPGVNIELQSTATIRSDFVSITNCSLVRNDAASKSIAGGTDNVNLTAGGRGVVMGCNMSGDSATDATAGIQPDDTRWSFHGNGGAPDSSASMTAVVNNTGGTIGFGSTAFVPLPAASYVDVLSSSWETTGTLGLYRYVGVSPCSFRIDAWIKVIGSVNNNAPLFGFRIELNGVEINPTARQNMVVSIAESVDAYLSATVLIRPTDVIRVAVSNGNGNDGTLTLQNLTLTADKAG